MSASPEKLAAVGTHRNPEHFKISIVQMALAGKSYTEIAAELGTNKGIVAGVVYRARKALRASPSPVKAAPPKMERCHLRSEKRGTLVENSSTTVWQPNPVHLTNAGPKQCRWPLWKANAPFSEKFVCGNQVKDGQSYCEHCYGLSYSPRHTREIDRKLNLKKLARAA